MTPLFSVLPEPRYCDSVLRRTAPVMPISKAQMDAALGKAAQPKVALTSQAMSYAAVGRGAAPLCAAFEPALAKLVQSAVALCPALDQSLMLARAELWPVADRLGLPVDRLVGGWLAEAVMSPYNLDDFFKTHLRTTAARRVYFVLSGMWTRPYAIVRVGRDNGVARCEHIPSAPVFDFYTVEHNALNQVCPLRVLRCNRSTTRLASGLICYDWTVYDVPVPVWRAVERILMTHKAPIGYDTVFNGNGRVYLPYVLYILSQFTPANTNTLACTLDVLALVPLHDAWQRWPTITLIRTTADARDRWQIVALGPGPTVGLVVPNIADWGLDGDVSDVADWFRCYYGLPVQIVTIDPETT
jgi:hypothetical protein